RGGGGGVSSPRPPAKKADAGGAVLGRGKGPGRPGGALLNDPERGEGGGLLGVPVDAELAVPADLQRAADVLRPDHVGVRRVAAGARDRRAGGVERPADLRPALPGDRQRYGGRAPLDARKAAGGAARGG